MRCLELFVKLVKCVNWLILQHTSASCNVIITLPTLKWNVNVFDCHLSTNAVINSRSTFIVWILRITLNLRTTRFPYIRLSIFCNDLTALLTLNSDKDDQYKFFYLKVFFICENNINLYLYDILPANMFCELWFSCKVNTILCIGRELIICYDLSHESFFLK